MISYNVKVFHYLGETQFRFYSKPINDNSEIDKDILKSEKQLYKIDEKKKKSALEGDNTRSLTVSQNRTINNIYELTRSNMWDYFITLTFDPQKVDRFNYDDCAKNVSKWLNNMKKNYAPDLRYILVPELHKNGAYHFHGLVANCGKMVFSDSGHKTKIKQVIYNLDNYKLGFTTATRVTDSNRASSYITKYITKELCATTKGKKRYWSSKNLNAPQIEKFLMSKEEKDILIDSIQGHITYTKGLNCSDADLSVLYVEVNYNKNGSSLTALANRVAEK